MIHPPQAAADTPSPGRKRESGERLMNPGMRQEGPQRKGQGKGRKRRTREWSWDGFLPAKKQSSGSVRFVT